MNFSLDKVKFLVLLLSLATSNQLFNEIELFLAG